MVDMSITIDNLLKSHGITGAKMCADLGMSKSFMTELRKGRAKSIKAETAQKIADYFGVTVGYLLGNEDLETKKSPDESKLTEGEQMLLDLFRRIPEDQKPIVINMIKAALGGGK